MSLNKKHTCYILSFLLVLLIVFSSLYPISATIITDNSKLSTELVEKIYGMDNDEKIDVYVFLKNIMLII